MSSFESADDLIDFACTQVGLLAPETFNFQFRKRGGAEILQRLNPEKPSVDQFYENLRFFFDENQKITARFGTKPTAQWALHSAAPACKYVSPVAPSAYIQEMQFGAVSFLGTQHYYRLKDEQIPEAQKSLQVRINKKKPDAIIIEGYEYGKPLVCKEVLKNVFTPTAILKSESKYVIREAFYNKIAIIPGDNQFPDLVDRSIFLKPNEDFEKVKFDFMFVDILHTYYSNLLQKISEPLKAAIESACDRRNYTPQFSISDFKKKYRSLNSRDLPTDPERIYEDFTPSIFNKKPRGTNQLVDNQDRLRNQSLLTTIQIASSIYRRPAVVFGYGHMASIGPVLEKNVGNPKNISFEDICEKQ